MKQFIKILIIAISMIVVAGCGTAAKYANDPFVGEGYGESINRNVAYDIAYVNAINQIAQKYNIDVVGDYRQHYSSQNGNRGKMTESINVKDNVRASYKVNASDVLVKEKHRRIRGGWYYEIVAKVSPENLY